MNIACQEYFESVLDFANRTNRREQFDKIFSGLESWDTEENQRVFLCKDFAPYSFYFEVEVFKDGKWVRRFNGGMIFHGSHDNGGDGSAPTFSVNLSPMDGWSLHT